MSLTRAERATLAAAVLLAIGAYAQSVGFRFAYDDLFIIQGKTLLHSLANWREILATTWWRESLYRPFTELWFAVDWAIGGGSPLPFHVVNVLIHATTTALVYLLALGGLGPVGAGAAALVFAVHPVHVEAVANVVGRAELLAALFTLIAALAYRADGRLAAANDRTWRRWLASFGTLAAVGLGMASKESAFAAPGVLILVDWWEGRRAGEPLATRFRRHAVLWLATVTLSLEWLWLRSSVVGGLAGDRPAAGLEGEGLVGRSVVMAPVVLQYVRLLFFPLKLSADYSPNFLRVTPHLTLTGLLGLLVLAAAVVVTVRARHRAPALSFALAWIGGTVLVVANLIVPTGVLVAERTLYLPSVGAALVVGWIAAWSEASWRHAGVGLTAVLVALGMTRTITRLPVWTDNDHLFPALVRDAPESYRSYWLAGTLVFNRGDPARGEALLRQSLRIYPLQPQAWETLALQMMRQGQWLQAARAFRAGYRLDRSWLEGAADGVFAYIRAGMVDSARVFADSIGAAAPHDFHYMAARAAIAHAEHRPLEEMTWRRQVAWQFPDKWQYWFFTAQAALDARYCPEARRSISRVRALNPQFGTLPDLESRLKDEGCAS